MDIIRRGRAEPGVTRKGSPLDGQRRITIDFNCTTVLFGRRGNKREVTTWGRGVSMERIATLTEAVFDTKYEFEMLTTALSVMYNAPPTYGELHPVKVESKTVSVP